MSSVKKFKLSIDFNAPVVLGFVAICFGALLLNNMTNGWTNRMLFSVYRSSMKNPLFYLRTVGHIFGHADWSHFANNMMYILILGPMLEEKYGSKTMMAIIALTGFVTGVVSLLFFPANALLGASGVVFAFILLASVTSVKREGIPLTFLLVAAIYIGGQIWDGLTIRDNVSNLTHIIGGVVGATCGFLLNKKK